MRRLYWYASLTLVAVLASVPARAAEISWSTAFEIETEEDINIENLIRAVNVVNPEEVDVIEVEIGGTTVEFEPEHTFEFNAELDEFFGSGGNVTGQGNFYSGQDFALTTENEDLDLVFDSHGWAGGGPGAAAAVLELQDLTVGESYQVQLIGAADDRDCCEFRQMEIWDEGENVVTASDGSDLWFGRSNDFDEDDERGPGSVIGTFTADADTQSIFLVGTAEFDDGNGGEGNGNDPGLSAYLLSAGGGAGVPGDVNGDGMVDATDIDDVAAAVLANSMDLKFDVNGDGAVSDDDRVFIVKDTDILNTWIGDANLDGEFNSSDFVSVFTGGQYEDAVDGNSGWADGDWNGDGDFTSGDFVAAFSDGGFEMGPRSAVAAVPEPTSAVLTLIALMGLTRLRRK